MNEIDGSGRRLRSGSIPCQRRKIAIENRDKQRAKLQLECEKSQKVYSIPSELSLLFIMLPRFFKMLYTPCRRCISTEAFAGNKWGVSRPRTLEDIRASLKSRASAEVETSERKGKARAEPVPEEFLKHRKVMKERFPDGWNPPRKLSREAMDGLRALHAHDPETFNTPALAEKFRISPEAVRRILKSKWLPKPEQRAKLLEKERRRKEEFKTKRIEREKEKELEWREAKARLGRLRRSDGFDLQ